MTPPDRSFERFPRLALLTLLSWVVIEHNQTVRATSLLSPRDSDSGRRVRSRLTKRTGVAMQRVDCAAGDGTVLIQAANRL